MQRSGLAYHPINLAVRFLLELSGLAAFSMLGWRATDHGVLRVVLAVLSPVAAAALWAVFAVPDDPSRSGSAPIPVPGPVRLLLELSFFAAATWALAAHSAWWAGTFAAVVAIHYAVSMERVRWLFGSR